jgi:hypothetical protein
MEEEIGDLPQGFHPFGRRTASDGVFEFGDDRVSRLLHHGGQSFLLDVEWVRADNDGPSLTPALKTGSGRNTDWLHLEQAITSSDHRATCRRGARLAWLFELLYQACCAARGGSLHEIAFIRRSS